MRTRVSGESDFRTASLDPLGSVRLASLSLYTRLTREILDPEAHCRGELLSPGLYAIRRQNAHGSRT